MRFRCQQLVVMVFLVLWPVAVAAAPELTREVSVVAAESDVVTLFSDVESSLDEFGRPTVFRLAFQYFAGIGPEDLTPPFSAYVEAGSLVYRDSQGDYIDIDVGDIVDVEMGDDYAIRSQVLSGARPSVVIVAQPGSCGRFPEAACAPHYLPYDFLCDKPCRPDITNTLLFNHQNTMLRLMDVTYTLQRVALSSGEEFTPVDPGGDGETIYLLMRVDVGTVQISTGESYTAGEAFVVESGQTLIVTGAEDAELFLLRVAKEE